MRRRARKTRRGGWARRRGPGAVRYPSRWGIRRQARCLRYLRHLRYLRYPACAAPRRENQRRARACQAHPPHPGEAGAKTQLGASIAAGPRSPDFDPLGASCESPAPPGFGGMLHIRRQAPSASRLRLPLPRAVASLRMPVPRRAVCPFHGAFRCPESLGCQPNLRASPACARATGQGAHPPISNRPRKSVVSLRHQHFSSA